MHFLLISLVTNWDYIRRNFYSHNPFCPNKLRNKIKLSITCGGLQPQPGKGSPSGPSGHGASNPGTPWSPLLPLSPFLPRLPGGPCAHTRNASSFWQRETPDASTRRANKARHNIVGLCIIVLDRSGAQYPDEYKERRWACRRSQFNYNGF